jgi:hypothetical protein
MSEKGTLPMIHPAWYDLATIERPLFVDLKADCR